MKKILVIVAGLFMLSGCVAKRYLEQSQQETATLRADSTELANRNSALKDNVASLNDQISSLQKNINDLNAQISDLKNQISHRGKAFRQVPALIKRLKSQE